MGAARLTMSLSARNIFTVSIIYGDWQHANS